MTERENLLVIGAGLPRTGTRSLSKALEQLLDGPCFHGSRLPEFKQSDIDFWIGALQDKPTSDQWREYLKNEKACLDYPCVLFYQDIMEAFPHAKVVATTRNADTWFDSWWSSIGMTLVAIDTQPIKWVVKLLENPKLRSVHETARKVVPKGCSQSLDDAFQSRESSQKFYDDWMAEVMRSVPKEKLLMYDIRQGWEPLCQFLQLPVPKNEFPRVNESAEIQSSIKKMKIISWSLTLGVPALTSALCYFIWKKLK